MIWVGLYYSRRVENRDDYFLGGRNMKPWMVGLSLFATIISTLSYLSYPGAMIEFGPVIFSGILVLPLAYYLVGWWLIPSLMGLNFTSGYEILEQRLGVSARLVGASVFLLLRLLWMGTIIYATAKVALLPVLGIDDRYAPLVCAIMGLITLGYTSLGGLRAVVLTDVIQSFILFGGAILTIILVTAHFGGFQWFPTTWPSRWMKPNFDLGLRGQVTVFNSCIWLLTWNVCTAGSDQMAIQRYLATRDAAAARRSFGVTLIATFLVKILLAIVGLAVLAYFIDQPQKLADRTAVLAEPDQLFSRYVLVGLPPGVTGLIVCGIMAAAMSSLSSGISASSSVISEDFIRRFRMSQQSGDAEMSQIRWISAIIGIVVVLLSLGVGNVEGNLFEVTQKVVNLLVAPLFVLFFMAIFVPWATAWGSIIGLAASAGVAVAIAFFDAWDISFMWIIPASLLVGISVGAIASLTPIGHARRDSRH